MDYDFEITNPPWTKVAATVLAIFGALVVIAGIILGIFRDAIGMPFAAQIIIIALGAFFFIIGAVALFAAIEERFMLSHGVFYYNKPFRKNQSASAEKVAEVRIRRVTLAMIDVVFCDADGNKLINFYDDGTALKNGEFEKALAALNIPVYRV